VPHHTSIKIIYKGTMKEEDHVIAIIEANIKAIIRDMNAREIDTREDFRRVEEKTEEIVQSVNCHTLQIQALLKSILLIIDTLTKWKKDQCIKCNKQKEIKNE